MSKELLIYGAGGFARELAWMIDSRPDDEYCVAGFIEDFKLDKPGFQDSRPIYTFEQARKLHPAAPFCIGVAHPRLRARIMENLASENIEYVTLVHHSLLLSDRVTMGESCIICQGVILTVDIQLGSGVQINLDCTIGHDVTIGDLSTLSPGVHVSGNVHIGKEVFVGTGATILNGTEADPMIIGDGAVIAGGACVARSVQPFNMVAGVPAVVKKVLSE